MSALGDILLGAVFTILQVFLTCLPGVVFARTGIVTGDVRRALSRISFNFLLPSITFVNIAPNVNLSTIQEWWPIFANVLLLMAIGLAVGALGSNCVPQRYRRAIIACAGFGNMNTLPLLLVNALCYSDKLPFHNHSPGQCSALATAFVALGSSTNGIFAYSLASWLLSAPPGEGLLAIARTSLRRASVALVRAVSPRAASQRPLALQSPFASAAALAVAEVDADETGLGAAGAGEDGGLEEPLLPLPNAEALATMASLATCCSEFEPHVAETTPIVVPPTPAPLKRALRRAETAARALSLHTLWLWVFKPALDTLLVLLPAPAIASIAGIVVGVSPPLRNLFFPVGYAPLSFVTASIRTWGAALVFTSAFVLGAVLSRGPGAGVEKTGVGAVALIAAIRLVVTPAIGQTLVFATYFAGWWKLPAVGGYTFFFVLLLQHCMPTANNVQNISTMLRYNEVEVAALLFWQYVLSIVTIPLWMTLDLHLLMKWGIIPQ